MQIVLENGAILDDHNIIEESMSLQESLCSNNNLVFGSCEASVFKIQLIEQLLPVSGKEITVSIPHNGEMLQLGRYKILSDTPTADRRYRDITAYDAMYDILHAEVSGWYNTILPTADSTVTLKAFRDSFLAYFGIEQENVTLVNDSMIVTKTIEPTSLSGKTVITAICEINGCFGHIGREGKFKYVFLQDTSLYPADTLYPADDLYPAGIDIPASCYIKAEYEDYTTALINKLQIRQEEDDIGCIYGTGDNCYIVQDNFLVYGKSSEELNVIAENLYSIISTVTYQPVHAEAKGNPCLEVGDAIELRTKNGVITSYILQRTLKGIQALRDTYDAEGEQYQTEKVNGMKEQIIQLKGKTNKLTRTVEETRLEIADLENGLNSRITQTAEAITLEVSKTYETITNASKKYEEFAASIKVNADAIKSKVSQGNISSEISQEAGQISIKANRFALESTNLTIVADGTITAKNVDLTGKITATSGEIGGMQITSKSISSGKTSYDDDSKSGVYLGTDGFAIGYSTNSCFKVSSLGDASIRGHIDIVTSPGALYTRYESTQATFAHGQSTNAKISYSGLIVATSNGEANLASGSLKIRYSTYGESEITHNGLKFSKSATVESTLYNGELSILAYDVNIGDSSGKISFFEGSGSIKKTVSTITSTSSATAATNATKINELINALKAYNLIG